jgi:hypothetical protein
MSNTPKRPFSHPLDYLFRMSRPEVVHVPQIKHKYYTFFTLQEAEEKREVVLAEEQPNVLDVQVIKTKLIMPNHRNIESIYQVKVTLVE